MTSSPKPKEKETFEAWFKRQKFKHFSADEFTSYFNVTRRGVKNSEPDRELWENIVPTLRVVDELRGKLGRSCVILSSYRSPAYNAAISGAAKDSYHKKFMALDIVFAGHSPEQVYDALLEMRAAGKFKGGLGRYNTFTHVDTRGYNATW